MRSVSGRGRAGLDGGAATRYHVHMTSQMKDSTTNFLLAIALIFGAAVLWGALAMGNDYECQDATVIVQPGDTLWNIVEEHCTGDVRAAVSNVAADPSTLQPGQVITLP